MSDMFPQLDQLKVEVGSDVKDRHLAAIGAELRKQPTGRRFGGRAFAVAVALVLLLPVIAVAAENSVPGDFFYPLKIWVEPAVVIVDPDAPAENRVREVEILFERDAPVDVVDDQIAVAWEAVDDPALEQRIVDVENELDQRHPERRVRDDAGHHQADHERPAKGEEEPKAKPDRSKQDEGVVAPGDPSQSSTTTTIDDTTTTSTGTEHTSSTRERRDTGGDG